MSRESDYIWRPEKTWQGAKFKPMPICTSAVYSVFWFSAALHELYSMC